LNKSTEKIRLLMFNEVLKNVMYNEVIPESTEFNLIDCAINWKITGEKREFDTHLAKFINEKVVST
jgi:hypothetical protein